MIDDGAELRSQQVRCPDDRDVSSRHGLPAGQALVAAAREDVGEGEVPQRRGDQREPRLLCLVCIPCRLLGDVALQPARAARQGHEVDVDLSADMQRLASVLRPKELAEAAHLRQRHGFSCSRRGDARSVHHGAHAEGNERERKKSSGITIIFFLFFFGFNHKGTTLGRPDAGRALAHEHEQVPFVSPGDAQRVVEVRCLEDAER